MANTLTIPVTFTDGTDALAADVNSDFNAVATFLNSTKLNDDNIKAGGIGSVSLASNAVQTAQIAANAVTDAAIQSGGLNTVSIANGAVTKSKLALRTIKTDGTDPGAGGIVFSPSCGSYSTTSSTFVTPTNLSVTLTTKGNPVVLCLVGDTSGNLTGIQATNSNGGGAAAKFIYYRGGTGLGVGYIANQATTAGPQLWVPAGSTYCVDYGATAGTYTYQFQVATLGATAAYVYYCQLMAYELV